MPEEIKNMLETAVKAEFISVIQVYNLAVSNQYSDWPNVSTYLCKQAKFHRAKNYKAWKYIVSQATCFASKWKIENW